MKELFFVGSSLAELRAFPEEARQGAGYDLRRVQSGLEPRDWKPMKSVGAGAREIREHAKDGEYRVFYVVESATAIYVLHAFQKKTQKTAMGDIELGKQRYKSVP